MLTALACAVCPVCVATYAKLLSLTGISVGLDPGAHEILMFGALSISVRVSAWRSWRTARAWPFVVAVSGSALVATGHLLGGLHAVEWAACSFCSEGA